VIAVQLDLATIAQATGWLIMGGVGLLACEAVVRWTRSR
jgi:hypothetical protein